MPRTWDVLQRIAAERLVAIVRRGTREEAAADVEALLTAGALVVEVSLTTPGALSVVEQAAATAGPDVVLGVGTVLSAADVRLASLAGARLVVTPTFDPDVVRAARRYGVATVVGCGSASEMLSALSCGADAVKLFPASTWTPADLRGLLQALPQLPVVPTGGVSLEDAPEWVAAGAVAVGIGSALTAGDAAQTGARLGQLRARLADAAP
jgi:2-dehydro-3-deoxyphosphogluconate aldolase/(4S)-4-hydroxy-2-oxoglutarate aldolase